MMNNGETKEVYFHKYCQLCQYVNRTDAEEPCDECLEHPSNEYSHKPVNFKEKEK